MDLEAEVRALVAVQCARDVSAVQLESSFDDLGITEVRFTELILALEEAFEVDIPDDDAVKFVTVADAVRLIANLTDGAAVGLDDFVSDLDDFATADEVKDAADEVTDDSPRTKAAALEAIQDELGSGDPIDVEDLLERILSECYAETLKNWCRQLLDVTPSNKDKAIELLLNLYLPASDEGHDTESDGAPMGTSTGSGRPKDLHDNEILVLTWANLPWPVPLVELKKARRNYSKLAHPDRQPGDAAGDTMVRFNDGCDRLERRFTR